MYAVCLQNKKILLNGEIEYKKRCVRGLPHRDFGLKVLAKKEKGL